MNPDVLYLILCESVQTNPNNFLQVDVRQLITRIRATANPPFPLVRPHLCILAIWTGGQGVGTLSIQVREDATGRIIAANQPRQVRFSGSPHAIDGVVFHLLNCPFPAAGLYWVELIFSGAVIARQRLVLE